MIPALPQKNHDPRIGTKKLRKKLNNLPGLEREHLVRSGSLLPTENQPTMGCSIIKAQVFCRSDAEGGESGAAPAKAVRAYGDYGRLSL